MIQHVSLEVAPEVGDLTVAFWALLGFDRVDPPGSLADRAAFLQSGPTQIHLIWTSAPVAPPYGHVAVVVEDYDGTRRRPAGGRPRGRPPRRALGLAARLRPRPCGQPRRAHGLRPVLARRDRRPLIRARSPCA